VVIVRHNVLDSNVEDFRPRSNTFQSVQEIYETLISAANSRDITAIKEMAVLDPEKRASAAQMLVKWFGGEGLSNQSIKFHPWSLWFHQLRLPLVQLLPKSPPPRRRLANRLDPREQGEEVPRKMGQRCSLVRTTLDGYDDNLRPRHA